MNMKLATQFLSDSISDALQYLNNEDKQFEESKATLQYCHMISNVFYMNSRQL